jgi:hypothetical protein
MMGPGKGNGQPIEKKKNPRRNAFGRHIGCHLIVSVEGLDSVKGMEMSLIVVDKGDDIPTNSLFFVVLSSSISRSSLT